MLKDNEFNQLKKDFRNITSIKNKKKFIINILKKYKDDLSNEQILYFLNKSVIITSLFSSKKEYNILNYLIENRIDFLKNNIYSIDTDKRIIFEYIINNFDYFIENSLVNSVDLLKFIIEKDSSESYPYKLLSKMILRENIKIDFSKVPYEKLKYIIDNLVDYIDIMSFINNINFLLINNTLIHNYIKHDPSNVNRKLDNKIKKNASLYLYKFMFNYIDPDVEKNIDYNNIIPINRWIKDVNTEMYISDEVNIYYIENYIFKNKVISSSSNLYKLSNIFNLFVESFELDIKNSNLYNFLLEKHYELLSTNKSFIDSADVDIMYKTNLTYINILKRMYFTFNGTNIDKLSIFLLLPYRKVIPKVLNKKPFELEGYMILKDVFNNINSIINREKDEKFKYTLLKCIKQEHFVDLLKHYKYIEENDLHKLTKDKVKDIKKIISLLSKEELEDLENYISNEKNKSKNNILDM